MLSAAFWSNAREQRAARLLSSEFTSTEVKRDEKYWNDLTAKLNASAEHSRLRMFPSEVRDAAIRIFEKTHVLKASAGEEQTAEEMAHKTRKSPYPISALEQSAKRVRETETTLELQKPPPSSPVVMKRHKGDSDADQPSNPASPQPRCMPT